MFTRISPHVVPIYSRPNTIASTKEPAGIVAAFWEEGKTKSALAPAMLSIRLLHCEPVLRAMGMGSRAGERGREREIKIYIYRKRDRDIQSTDCQRSIIKTNRRIIKSLILELLLFFSSSRTVTIPAQNDTVILRTRIKTELNWRRYEDFRIVEKMEKKQEEND